ncbi:MAG: sporulation protein YunB [Clostridia bacterium]|nr:sporulation protein YunB [Clostridia bacterium]
MSERFGIRKSNKKSTFFNLLLLLFSILFAFNTVTKYIEPTLMELCNVRAESLGISISNEVVEEVMRDVGYLDLIILDRNEEGKILALRANVMEMNRIASEISKRIQEKNDKLEASYIKIPIGNFTGNSLLAGHGPAIEVKIISTGTVNIEFKTEFLSTGINQTRHRVFLEIKSKMGIVAPFTSKRVEVINEVNVAETVLIGDVPVTYYNLEGVEDLTTDDTLNMWE